VTIAQKAHHYAVDHTHTAYCNLNLVQLSTIERLRARANAILIT
jgi:hypothetical protein